MRKPKTARAVHANRGVEAKYRKALQQLISDMHGSVEYWLKAGYRKHPPRVAELVDQAQDASPAQAIQRIFQGLAKRWNDKFDEMADKVAKSFLESMLSTTDLAFRAALKDAGWTVDFKMTPAMRDAFNASLSENVGLIRSIPEQYLQKVEGVVMRSYSAGRDLETMTKDLKRLYPITSRRAELIARDQSNKANSVITQTRRLELGITKAVWMHSHAGKTPRPDHVAADGKEFDVAKGCLISGEYIQPGEEINCRCTSRSVLPI